MRDDEFFLDPEILVNGGNFNIWHTIPLTCVQVMVRGDDMLGNFHIRHDPDCTEDHVKEPEPVWCGFCCRDYTVAHDQEECRKEIAQEEFERDRARWDKEE